MKNVDLLRKKSPLSPILVALLLVLSSISARADVFDFSFTGPSDSGSGTITANATETVGEFVATSMSGVTDGVAISSLLPPNTYPASVLLSNDNDLYDPAIVTFFNSGPAYLDIYGFSYELVDGTIFNLYYGVYMGSDPEIYNLLTGDYVNDALTSFTLTDITPEPSSLLLLGTGALVVFCLLWRRRTA